MFPESGVCDSQRSVSRISLRTTIICGAVLMWFSGAALGEIVLPFSEETSIGELSIRKKGTTQGEWKPFAPARGKVAVPDEMEVLLDVPAEALDFLDTLSAIPEGGIHSVRFFRMLISPAHLRALASLKNLREVWFTNVRIRAETLEALAPIGSLESLHLNASTFRPADLAALAKLPPLRFLSFRHAKLFDSGLGYLPAMPQLEYLDLTGTRVTDQGLPVLMRFPNLRTLYLGGTPIGDASMEHIAALTALESLVLPKTVSEAGIAQLEGAPAYKALQAGRSLLLRVVDKATGAGLHDAEVSIKADAEAFTLRTATDGTCLVQLPAIIERYLAAEVKAPGYVPLGCSWWLPDHAIPENFTFETELTTPVSGVVVDEAGAAVSGAKVVLNISCHSSPDLPYVYIPWESQNTTTDEAGRWQCACAPADFPYFNIRVYHREFLNQEVHSGPGDTDITALQKCAARIELQRGVAFVGRVVAPDRTPIMGARVAIGRSTADKGYQRTSSLADGRFSFQKSVPGVQYITVYKEGWAPAMKRVVLRPETAPTEIVLAPGKTISGRVVNTDGDPVAGARVAVYMWRDRDLLDWSARTDAEGHFRWESAPNEAVHFEVRKLGYMPENDVYLAPGPEEQTVTIAPVLRVSGRVTDATTGAPIPAFRVVEGAGTSDHGPDQWWSSSAVEGSGGLYVYEIQSDFPKRAHFIRFEADGYVPTLSRALKRDEGAATINVQMTPAELWEGVVLCPDGAPAAGAEIMAASLLRSVSIQDGHFSQELRVPPLVTNAGGRFTVARDGDPWKLVILHEQGFAMVSHNEMSPQIRLQPWARVEGEVRAGGQTVPDDRVYLWDEERRDDAEPYVYKRHDTRTDTDGRFRFERVIPGAKELGRTVKTVRNDSEWSHTTYIEVAPGETRHVTLGGEGPKVAGRLVLPGNDARLLESASLRAIASRQRTPCPWPENLQSDEERSDWYEEWSKTPEGRAWGRYYQYAVQIDPDGSFSISDIPPGKYELYVSLEEARFEGHTRGGTLGQAAHEFTVPGADTLPFSETLDIGEVEFRLYERPELDALVADFELPRLDGSTLKLSDYRGKCVLLDFWATWCGPCREEVKYLKQAMALFGENPDFAIVSVSFDATAEKAKKYVEENGMNWAHAIAEGIHDREMHALYGINGIPAIFLIDPQGRMIAKDLRGQAMLDAIKAALD